MDKALKRLLKRQRYMTQPGAFDDLISAVPKHLVTIVCSVCTKEFKAVQVGHRKPSSRCSEACRREARRLYSLRYAATARAELAELRRRVAAGDCEQFGIGRDGKILEGWDDEL